VEWNRSSSATAVLVARPPIATTIIGMPGIAGALSSRRTAS
jgi:hypothetical protein